MTVRGRGDGRRGRRGQGEPSLALFAIERPIAHLYKSQVYQIAEYLGVSPAITRRPPTTDTYSIPQTQEEFYFSLPTETMDLVLHAYNAGLTPDAAAVDLGYPAEHVTRAFQDIEQKRLTTRYLHLRPLLVEPVPEVCDHFEAEVR